jgi:Zn-dependent metalloprotease
MKKYFIIILIVIAYSCEKKSNELDNGCTYLVHYNPAVQLVSKQDLDSIKYLLDKFKVNYENLQFFQYSDIGFKYIRSYQYVNNLKLFTDGMSFSLNKTDSVFTISGDRVTSIDLTNKPEMSLNKVRKIFFKEIGNDEIIRNSGLMIDSCINIEFGYYNLNTHNILKPKDYITAWKVNPQDNEYPQAYINDLNGNVLDYFNGIYAKK